jgi:nucleoside-diphosphate-sugar epimerase
VGWKVCYPYSGTKNTMKVLVTGATGFIGQQVINHLLEYDVDIVATANIPKECIKNISWKDQVNYIECDLTKRDVDYFNFFKGPDMLIHLAWGNLPNYRSKYHIEVNLLSNLSFINSIISGGLANINVLGTCLEYGMQNGCLKEEKETYPENAYALAKDILRKFIQELSKHYGFQYNWIRLFYIYGKGQNKNSLFGQLENAIENHESVFNMSGGEQIRDYLQVEKAAEYIVKISLNPSYQGIINCCSGIPVSIRKLVETYLNLNGVKMKLNLGFFPYPDYEPMAFWGDNFKLKQLHNGQL